MAFLMGVVAFILGTLLVAVCLVAIPGAEGDRPPPPAHGHGGH
ncbi:MAG TPA: hypothetical protein VEI03_22565 [Stellaceae bacterium]|nr:hypothetical protein [Stellaceae bacterium]